MKKHNAFTAMRVSLDATDMRASVDTEESQVVSSSGEKRHSRIEHSFK